MGSFVRRIPLALAAGAALSLCQPALALDSFTIGDIRAEGLQRLEIGTVLTYLPLSVGDELNEASSRQALRALYRSGLFDDAALERDGNTLVIRVTERPAIAEFKLEGNDKVGGDELNESLADAGLAEGELFKRDLLSEVEQELQRQYFANGYYDVQIDTTVEDLPNNRVKLDIEVVEGKVTRIRQINVLGNTVFNERELLDAFELSRTKKLKPFQSSDKYSKQQLSGDLETLASYYQDRGYLKFAVTSVQVQLSPDKKDIFLTINVDEGEIYTVSQTRFSGETVLPVATLERFLSMKAGDTFSRKEATESADRIEAALSDIGYAFAEVTPMPEVDEDARTVGLNFMVQPGKRTYVRRIQFEGNTSTNDETLRREMRQLEAAPFSKALVERSRVRLARLAFVEEAEVETQPVAGSEDLVDVSFTIKERPPGAVQFGLGYSGYYGFMVNGSVTHTNWLGSGNRVSVELSNSSIQKAVGLSWTDPYFTADGISQTAAVTYRKTDGLVRRYTSGFSTNVLGASLTYGIPLSEYASLRLGGGIEDTAVNASAFGTSDEVLQFLLNNGTRFTGYELRTGIVRDSRNRTFFASRGSLNQLFLDVAVPGSDLEYYKLTYQGQNYVPLAWGFFLELNSRVAMVEDYASGDSQIPPWERLYAGGSKTVRGFRDGSLGPRNTPFNDPYGGQFSTTMQAEMVIPLPFETDQKSTRLSAFFDIGQAYDTPGDWEAQDLRQSAGMSVQWFTPFLGLLELSYAFPLNEELSDETDRFQITFGGGF